MSPAPQPFNQEQKVESTSADSSVYKLPPEILEYQELAKRLVREELLPLEQEYLAHPGHAYGVKETINLKAVFKKDAVDRLIKISRDTGLWYMMVPEKFGGSGLSMLAQVVVLEQFMYTPVPFPFANVPNILYECKGEQIKRFLTPVIEGEKTTCFAQTEANAGSDPGGMMQTKAVKDGKHWVLNGTKMWISICLLYTSDAADDLLCVDLGGRRIIKKKK